MRSAVVGVLVAPTQSAKVFAQGVRPTSFRYDEARGPFSRNVAIIWIAVRFLRAREKSSHV